MGGSQFQAKMLVERLHQDHQVTVAYFTARARRLKFDDHVVVPMSSKTKRRRYGHFWDYFELQKALREFQPAVVYQRVACAYTGISARFAKANGVPMIWHMANEHDAERLPAIVDHIGSPHTYVERRLKAYGARTADIVVAQTADQSRKLQENHGRNADRVIRNFLPQSELAIKNNDSIEVLWIANFKSTKQPEVFLDIVERLTANPQIHFTMIGQPYSTQSKQNEFDKKIRNLPNLSYLGPLTQAEVEDRLGQGHLLVNTSKWEGFSNTFIQAWMRSVPVLTLGVDPDGLLGDCDVGRAHQSTVGIANSIKAFAENPDMLVTTGRKCRELALQEFSMDNADELAALVMQAASRRRST